jgi:sulfoxide reductase heme-binding subunit YedZ
MEDPVWTAARLAGAAAVVLLTASLAIGIATGRGWRPRWVSWRAVEAAHRDTALAATALTAIHVLGFLIVPGLGIRLLDAVVPFVGRVFPFWQGLGTLAVDILLAVVVTSLLRRRVGRRTFRIVHLTTWLLWPIAVGHALGDGASGTAPGFLLTALGCAAAIVAAVSVRFSTAARPVA